MAVSERTSHTVQTDSPSAASPDQRLSDVFAPCFTLILKLRAADDFGAEEMLRRRIKDLLERTERDALGSGVAPDAIQSAKFAIVAFLDETILSSNWAQKDVWMNTPIQLELYDRFDAGEVFFDRLHRLLDDPRVHAEVLEVYFLCMALGFKGQYQLHEQEQLRALIETTQEKLSQVPKLQHDALAPHGAPRGQVATEVKSKMPPWVVAAAAALIGFLIYAGMYLYISASANDVAMAIQQLASN